MKKFQGATRKSGHSIITTLPPDVLKYLNIEVGDQVEYVITENRVEIHKVKKETDDFLAIVNTVMNDYNEALEGLVSQ